MTLRERIWAGLLCAGVLGGCTLGSDQPFIPHGDNVPGLIDGDYQRFVIADPAEVPAGIRKNCLVPGYVFPMPDEKGKRRGRTLKPSYCPSDGSPLVRLTREGDAYWLTAPDQRLNIRFKQLRAGIYLVQSDDPGSDGLRYGYALTREAPGGIDMALLSCDYFPGLQSIHETEASNAIEAASPSGGQELKPEPEPEPEPEPVTPVAGDVLPSQNGDCRAPSLAAIQPELDAVVDRFARGREIVWFLLRRVP